jgi:hypothetical protein
MRQKYQALATPMAPTDPGLRPRADGKLDPDAYRAYLEKRLSHGFDGKPSRLIGLVPKGGEEFGIKTGSAREWANFMTRLGFHEGELSTNGVGDNGRSHALFGLSPGDSAIIGATKVGSLGRKHGGAFTVDELRDPRLHTDATIALLETKLQGNPNATMRKALSYWGPIKNEHWKPGQGRDYVLRENAAGKLAVDRTAPRPDGGIRNRNYATQLARQEQRQQKKKQQVADMRAAGRQTTRRSKKHRHDRKHEYAARKSHRDYRAAMGRPAHKTPTRAATPTRPQPGKRLASLGL